MTCVIGLQFNGLQVSLQCSFPMSKLCFQKRERRVLVRRLHFLAGKLFDYRGEVCKAAKASKAQAVLQLPGDHLRIQ